MSGHGTGTTGVIAGEQPIAQRAPGPPASLILGHLRGVERDPLGFFTRAQREYGDIVGLRLLTQRACLLAHPDHVKHVLHDRHANYDKNTWDFRMLKPVLGDSLLTTDGSVWLRQRRLMQPAFHKRRIDAFATIMVDQVARLCERWTAHAKGGELLDVAAEMNRLTLDIVTESLFGTQVGTRAALVGESVRRLSESFVTDIGSPLGFLSIFLKRPLGRARRPAAALHAVVQEIIERRLAAPDDDRDDLLALLLAARDEETGERMDPTLLRNPVLTLFVAGHETPSNALAWTWYLLSTHPLVAERLRAELAQGLGGRTPTIDDLPHLGYARMVVEEAMRLYPPAWATSRNPIEDDEIDGIRIPKGTLVFLSPYLTHRHPDFWENPEGFDPERFRPERTRERHRFAYFPFGGGPHLCIGETFAMTEATLVLATVAQRFRLDLAPGERVEPAPLVTMRPRDGLPMHLHPLH
jgi:cytochrome P450